MDERQRRRRLPRQVREQQIIDVAVGVFSRRGYHAASVDEIAELAGISKPMVYLYLDSKEGLFLACVRREAARLGAAFQDAALTADPEDGAADPELRLHAGLSAFFAYVAEHRDAWVVLHRQVSQLSDTASEELAAARRAVREQVAGLVRESVLGSPGAAGRSDAGDAVGRGHAVGRRDAVGQGRAVGRVQLDERETDFVAHTLVGAADQLTDWMDRHPEETPERVALRLMNVVWVGMRNVLQGEVWASPRSQ